MSSTNESPELKSSTDEAQTDPAKSLHTPATRLRKITPETEQAVKEKIKMASKTIGQDLQYASDISGNQIKDEINLQPDVQEMNISEPVVGDNSTDQLAGSKKTDNLDAIVPRVEKVIIIEDREIDPELKRLYKNINCEYLGYEAKYLVTPESLLKLSDEYSHYLQFYRTEEINIAGMQFPCSKIPNVDSLETKSLNWVIHHLIFECNLPYIDSFTIAAIVPFDEIKNLNYKIQDSRKKKVTQMQLSAGLTAAVCCVYAAGSEYVTNIPRAVSTIMIEAGLTYHEDVVYNKGATLGMLVLQGMANLDTMPILRSAFAFCGHNFFNCFKNYEGSKGEYEELYSSIASISKRKFICFHPLFNCNPIKGFVGGKRNISLSWYMAYLSLKGPDEITEESLKTLRLPISVQQRDLVLKLDPSHIDVERLNKFFIQFAKEMNSEIFREVEWCNMIPALMAAGNNHNVAQQIGKKAISIANNISNY